jgi:ABC-2 type transport system permease protein
MSGKVIRTIARKEFTEMTRDGRFRVTSLIVFVLLLASLVAGRQHYRETRRQQEAAQAATRRQWEGQETKNPHSAAHFGTYAFKSPMPLSYVDKGVDAYTGVTVWLEAHKQNPFLFRPAEDALSVSRFGESTAANVLQLLLPLVIILLAFEAFAAERERGTLRQLLSMGIGRRELAFGKTLGTTAALAVLLVPSTLVGVIALALSTNSALLINSLPRLALMIAGYLFYFAAFLFLSLAVSSRASSSRGALVVLLAFWMLNSLVLPRLAADAAERLYPTPSGSEFWAQIEHDMKEGVDGHDPAASRTEAYKQQVLDQYGVTKVEDLPVNFAGLSLQAGEEYGNTVFDRRYAELWATYEKQNRLRQVTALLAPLEAVRTYSMGLAGTDFAQQRDFAIAAEQYRRMLNRTMNLDIAYNSRSTDTAYRANSDLWHSLPEFAYTAPRLGAVVRQQAGNFALLALWFVATGAIALTVVGKLRP